MDQVERQDSFLSLEIIFAHCPFDGTSPISRACGEIYCTAPRRAGPWHSEGHGVDAHDGPCSGHGQFLRFRTRTLGVGPRCGWRLLPECPLPLQPTVPFQPRFLLPALTVRFSPRKSPHRVRLALSQGCRESSKRHIRSRRRSVLVQGFGNSSPPMSAPATPFELDAQERSVHGTCRLRQLSGRPAWSNATSYSRLLQSFPISARQRPLVGLGRQLSLTQPVVRRSATGPSPPLP